MARTQGRVLVSIWRDEDFLALPVGAQRLYLFFVSQGALSHAGLLPLRERAWTGKAAGYTAEQLSADLRILEAARFVIVDYNTQEVLIRTLVRNDGVYKQPKLMLRLAQDAQQIESSALRAVFAAELTRLPLHELSDLPSGRNGDEPSTRECVQRVVDALVSALTPPSGYPTGGVSDTHPDTPPDGIPEGHGDALRGRAGAFLLPPTTSHLPPPPTTVGGPREKRRAAAIPIPNDWRPTDEHRRYATEHGLDLDGEAERFRFHAHAYDRRMVRWNAGFSTWLSKSAAWETPHSTAVAKRGSGTPTSTTDQRVAVGMSLTRHFEALEEGPL